MAKFLRGTDSTDKLVLINFDQVESIRPGGGGSVIITLPSGDITLNGITMKEMAAMLDVNGSIN